jgi:hypothetical protein
MPRICEALNANFGDHPLIITDVAIPFSSQYLNDARVAIVDDVVNFGSTLAYVSEIVQRHAPANIRRFSLATRQSRKQNYNDRDFQCAHIESLTDDEYSSYVRRVPAAINHVCKPYDLVFPIIAGRYRIPFRNTSEILDALREKLEGGSIQLIPSPYTNSPIRRISLLLPDETNSVNRKIRIYFDDSIGQCSIVPMTVPSCIRDDKTIVKLPWVANLQQQLKSNLKSDSTGDTNDALCTISLFTSALDWFWGSANQTLSDVLDFEPNSFSIADARLVFGPKIAFFRNECEITMAGPAPVRESNTSTSFTLSESPFLNKFDADDLIQSTINWLLETGGDNADSIDCYRYLLGIMTALAKIIGSESPADYRAVWPFSKQEILKNPYLRLRIGPTFSDLVELCRRIYHKVNGCEIRSSAFVKTLSGTFDNLIDQGAIVPTFAHYNNESFRIYRRGEGPGKDTCEQVLCAFAAYAKPLSSVRFAKVLATLSHSRKYHQVLSASAQTHGLVGGVRQSVFQSEPNNISTYCLRTGQNEPVKE